MKVAVLLAVLVGVAYSQVNVPLGALQAVRNAGMQTINDGIGADNKRLLDAVEAFKPINATCNSLLSRAISKCGTCVEQKCKARAQKVCKPEKWQEILGKTIGFFKDGVPNFITGTIPDVFVNKIGGGIVDVSKDVADFFKDKIGGGIVKIGEGAIDFGKNIGNGVVDIGKKIGDGVVDVGKKIGNGVVDVGKKIGEGVGKALDGIKDIGSKIGKAFGSIFGKRQVASEEKLLVSRRSGEPGCGEFENNAEQACRFYLKPSYCVDCGFSAEAKCPGYKAATAEIKAANEQRKWMTTIQKQNYDITEMSFNPALMSGNGGFKNVVVSVNIFGKDLQFTLRQPINPYIPTVAGPIIARRALEEYKK